jgi:hypothetical protein
VSRENGLETPMHLAAKRARMTDPVALHAACWRFAGRRSASQKKGVSELLTPFHALRLRLRDLTDVAGQLAPTWRDLTALHFQVLALSL